MWTRTWTEASLVAPVSWSESLKSVCYYSRFKTLRAPRHLLLWGFPSSFLSFHRVFCRRSRDPASLTNSASAAKDPSKLQVTPDVPEASIYLLMLCLYYVWNVIFFHHYISSFCEKRQSPKLVSEFRLQLLHRGLVFKVAKNQAWTTSLQPLIKIQISSMIFTGPR
ncbi:hypothetical protein F2Q68_00012883 [Brassica cretica]|uniref:Uncharacterized protein n=1 Tax=Brassica cretica TaxID=69181 RepID=A0A8S9HGI7_BRACR|nr:hypothetical protein F2Q68_00012883 [Brassica cretica]